MLWTIKNSEFLVPLGEDLVMNEKIANEVMSDYNNGRVKINGIDAKEVKILDDFLTFLYVYYKTEEKEKKGLATLVVQMLFDNLPNVFFVEADGFRYIKIDVRLQSIDFEKK